MSIPLKSFSTAIRKLSDLQKALPAIQIDITPTEYYSGNTVTWKLEPSFKNINDIPSLAGVCEAINWYLPESATRPLVSSSGSPLLTAKLGLAEQVSRGHNSLSHSSVKYFFDIISYFPMNGFGLVVPVLILSDPIEYTHEGKTYRAIHGSALPTTGNGASTSFHGPMNFAVSTDSPLYNYMDRGHIIFFSSKLGGDPQVFICNQLGLNVYYFAALFAVVGSKLTSLLRDGVFLQADNSAALQRILLAAEREISKDSEQDVVQGYARLKQHIRQDFEKNAQHVLVAKYKRGEVKQFTLHNIKFTNESATYETIKLAAPNLSEVLLNRVDTNTQFDIYQLVDLYISTVLEEMDRAPMLSNGRGFAEAREWSFSINDIPLRLSVTTSNTRRRVNGHLINTTELARVLRRATCYQDAAAYDKFLRQIAKASLRVHDAIANGVPVKIFCFSSSDYYRPVTNKHPKIFFVCDEGKYFLWLNKDKTRRVPLRRFVGLLDEIASINHRTNNGYQRNRADGDFTYRTYEWCTHALKHAILQHAVDDKGVALLTLADLDPLIEWLLEARSEAEKKSEKLLKACVEETKAKECTHNGAAFYEIIGNSGASYTVEKTPPFKVWNTTTKAYVCIVDGQGEMGAGYDALVARLMALKNDTFVVNKIGTLRTVVNEARVRADSTALETT